MRSEKHYLEQKRKLLTKWKMVRGWNTLSIRAKRVIIDAWWEPDEFVKKSETDIHTVKKDGVPWQTVAELQAYQETLH